MSRPSVFDLENELKKCGRCQRWLPYAQFNSSPGRKLGLSVYCKDCKRAESTAWREVNAGYFEDYYIANRGHLIAAMNARREVRSPQQVEADLVYRRQYYVEHKDKMRAAMRVYEQTHRAEVNAMRRRWWAALGPERKERYREYNRAYRARKFGATVGVITDDMIAAKWDYWSGRCWMCGREASEWDHLKPLARGGLHALANSRPACRNCNARKSDIWPFDLTPYQDPFGLAMVPLDAVSL